MKQLKYEQRNYEGIDKSTMYKFNEETEVQMITK